MVQQICMPTQLTKCSIKKIIIKLCLNKQNVLLILKLILMQITMKSPQQQMNQIILLRLKKRKNGQQKSYRDEIALQFISKKQPIRTQTNNAVDQSDKIDDQIIRQFQMINLQKKGSIPNFFLQRIDPSKYFAKNSQNVSNQAKNTNQNIPEMAVDAGTKTTQKQQVIGIQTAGNKQEKSVPEFVAKARDNITNSLRNIREQRINISRQKFKIINVETKSDEKYVDFKGVKYYYENLDASDIDEAYDYYVIKRNKFLEDDSKIDYKPMTTLYIPKEYESMLEDNDNQNLQGIMEQQDKSDSNREDRSDYDYPDEQSSQRNSAYDDYEAQQDDALDSQDQDDFDVKKRGKDQKNKKRNTWRDDSVQYEEDRVSLDSEKLYKQYLQRCDNSEQQDGEMVQCD